MTELIVTVISGVLTLIGVCVTAWASGRKTQTKLETAQAVTDTKLDELAREVRAQNELVRRIPVMEVQLHALQERKELSHPAC